MLEHITRARQVNVPRWVNARTFLGVVLFITAYAGSQRVLAQADDTTAIWVAARDLPQDTPLDESNLKAVYVDMPAELLDRYATRTDELTGSVLTAAVRAGELLPKKAITPAALAAQGRSITIPVSPDHALGGELSAGDRVDVFGTFNASNVRAKTVQIARDITVLDTVAADGLIGAGESAIGVTVAVSPETALSLANAIRTAEIDVARIHNGGRISSQTRVTSGEVR